MFEKINIRKILVAPLDWGLGHATRDIPIIQALLHAGYEVLIAAEGAQASILQNEFSQITILPLKGYHVHYSKSKWGFLFTILRQLPRISKTIRTEHAWLDTMIEKHQIDLVITDNRFGLYSSKIPCLFITHQLTVKAPFKWLEYLIQKVNYRFINRFTACWVPDMAGAVHAAGILSHPSLLPKIPVHYLGLISRFQLSIEAIKYDYCILLSGPEPQRTLLENKLLKDLHLINAKILFLRGMPGTTALPAIPSNVEIHNHLPTNALQKAIGASDYIICRGGYTSLMELFALKKKMLLIPTPGQTEQEYLAEILMKQHACLTVPQSAFALEEHLPLLQKFPFQLPAFTYFKDEDIKDLMNSIRQ